MKTEVEGIKKKDIDNLSIYMKDLLLKIISKIVSLRHIDDVDFELFKITNITNITDEQLINVKLKPGDKVKFSNERCKYEVNYDNGNYIFLYKSFNVNKNSLLYCIIDRYKKVRYKIILDKSENIQKSDFYSKILANEINSFSEYYIEKIVKMEFEYKTPYKSIPLECFEYKGNNDNRDVSPSYYYYLSIL